MSLRSLLAVMLQSFLSASNLISFFIFIKHGFQTEISIAVAIVGLAYAFAEGGVSVVAPRLLNRFNKRKIYFAKSIISLTSFAFSLIIIASCFLVGLYKGWDYILWILSYSIGVWMILLTPSWFGVSFFGIYEFILLAFSRVVQLLILFYFPNLYSYAITSALGLLFVFLIISRTLRFPLFIPSLKTLKLIANEVSLVFSGKTLAFVVYSALPLILEYFLGSKSLVSYLVIERVKSFYSSVFAPVIQMLYISISNLLPQSNKLLPASVLALLLFNLFLAGCLISIESDGWSFSISKLVGFNSNSIVFGILAASISVFSSIFLHFYLAIRRIDSAIFYAAILQMVAFFILIFLVFCTVLHEEKILLYAESVYLISLIFFGYFLNSNYKKVVN